MSDRQYVIPTQPGMGRGLVNHDERSKMYRAVRGVESKPLVTRTHRRGGPYNQGSTSECVAYTGKGVRNTSPFAATTPYSVRSKYPTTTWYHGAQQRDEWDGEAYNGTSALGLCRYLQEIKVITQYTWCFGLQETLQTLSHKGPVAIGTWWKTDMWNTDAHGFIHASGGDAGGHETELIGINVPSRYVIGMNSWGPEWGVNGRYKLSFEDLGKLLDQHGDAVFIG